jgi:hypothetical protein
MNNKLLFGLGILILVMTTSLVISAKPSPNPTKLELINSFTQKEGLTVTDYGREDATHYWVNVTKNNKSYIMIVNKDYVMEYYNAQK